VSKQESVFWLDSVGPGITVEVDGARVFNAPGGGGYHHDALPKMACGEYVRVMSCVAGGQIRAYVRHGGALWLCSPAYHGPWPELDVAVESALGCPVKPYRVDVGGRVTFVAEPYQPNLYAEMEIA
jgi:hypothetical protein